MNLRSTLILSALVRIGRTRAVFLAPPGCGVGPVSDNETLCQLERPVRPFCGIRLADHRPKLLGWDEILQAFGMRVLILPSRYLKPITSSSAPTWAVPS